MKLKVLLFLLLLPAAFAGAANGPVADTTKTRKVKPEVHFPDPGNVSRLFYVQRDPNANTVIYELNMKNGEPDPEAPVHPYWIKYNERGQKEELNYIQRKFAYGLASEPVAGGYNVRFVCYKKLVLNLHKGDDGKYHMFATIGKKQAVLNRIFAKIEGGSFWLPNVVYVELKGTDPATGKEVTERFKP